MFKDFHNIQVTTRDKRSLPYFAFEEFHNTFVLKFVKNRVRLGTREHVRLEGIQYRRMQCNYVSGTTYTHDKHVFHTYLA